MYWPFSRHTTRSFFAQAHFFQVQSGFAGQFLREAAAVAVDVFHRKRAEDGAQVSFQSLKDDALNLVVGHSEEAFRGGL